MFDEKSFLLTELFLMVVHQLALLSSIVCVCVCVD